jgi:small-conductance mechanosensitive channel
VNSLWSTWIEPWLGAILLVVGAVAVALVVHGVLIWALRRWSVYRAFERDLVRTVRRPARWLFVLGALYLVEPYLPLRETPQDVVRQALQVAIILAGAWLLIGASRVVEVFFRSRYRSDIPDNLDARRIQTKVQLLRRVVVAVVGFGAVGLILMTFESVRQIGISLFASAGVAGIVVGVAAQPTLSNLIAGLQLALSEPIRLDDVVIVEGEWGRVEEITMTYVVVRIWDLRRMVVPLRWFIENPFENWTRQTADLLGPVVLHLDYRAPIGALREELERVLARAPASELWDGEVQNVQVVDTTERTMKVRVLVSAPDSAAAWELRTVVREALITFLQRNHPEALPTVRAEVEEPGRSGLPVTSG